METNNALPTTIYIMSEPLVSIIAPAYNCKETIKDTFDSALSQAYHNWEWIIVDDCSKDDSFLFIKELVKNKPRIAVLQTPKMVAQL